jgi:hypothetical protein
VRLQRVTRVCLLALSAVPSCGLLFPHHRAAPPPTAVPTQVLVAVTSHNWSDITVYLLAGGLPQRLGMVSALGDFSSHRLNTSAGVRLRALPIAGRAFTSETILVQPGQSIFWTLENNLETSNFTVY